MQIQNILPQIWAPSSQQLQRVALGGLLLWLCGGSVSRVLAGSLQPENHPQLDKDHQRSTADPLHDRLLDRCCQVGNDRASELQKSNCKLSAREALAPSDSSSPRRGGPLSSQIEQLLARDSDFSEQCELLLGSCCLAEHRKRNCESGKQFAKSGSTCMDVELSKDTTVAAESFNDCCMACSLGVLASRSNDTVSLVGRCKLMAPLANSLSGQLYEQSYIECCQENLPRLSGALTELAGQPIDCAKSNPCAQRCIPNSRRLLGTSSSMSLEDRCDCFTGYKLALDGLNCIDIDECKLNQHTCNRNSEICDNINGGFRCLARNEQQTNLHAQPQNQIHNQSPHHHQGENSLPSLSGVQRQSELESGAQFVSLRLCPLGSHWDSHEHRCKSSGGFQF